VFTGFAEIHGSYKLVEVIEGLQLHRNLHTLLQMSFIGTYATNGFFDCNGPGADTFIFSGIAKDVQGYFTESCVKACTAQAEVSKTSDSFSLLFVEGDLPSGCSCPSNLFVSGFVEVDGVLQSNESFQVRQVQDFTKDLQDRSTLELTGEELMFSFVYFNDARDPQVTCTASLTRTLSTTRRRLPHLLAIH
jgi:hypothetical protein